MTQTLSSRGWLILFIVALSARIALALPQAQPGYMDAAYYFNIADNLASGRGLTEDFLWNYLARPSGLPQPSNAYWMPLTSVVVAPFLAWFGRDYRVAQAPMILLSAALVPLTYWLSLRLFQRRDWALVSALLMLASSFYTPFWSAIDSFALYALIGAGVLLLSADQSSRDGGRRAFACGLLVALAHLTRADGFLLFAPFVFRWWTASRKPPVLVAAVAGYLLLMLPWFARNVQAFGAPLAGGALFLRAYDDLFSYEKPLTFDYWLGAGIESIGGMIARAVVLNLATILGALHIVFFPFALIGAWRERRAALVQAVCIYLLVLYAVMNLALSAVSWRGTMLHSLTAALPMLYALAPVGLSTAIVWVAHRRRTWSAAQAERVFTIALLLLAVLLSGYYYLTNVSGSAGEPEWNARFAVYREVGDFIARQKEDASAPIMCINPPAYYYFNRRAAIAIPSDGVTALIHAAERFGARYVILESDHPRYLKALYDAPLSDERFRLRATFENAAGAKIFVYEIGRTR